MTKKETESERARAKAAREKLPQDLRAKITEVDKELVTFLEEHDAKAGPDSEDNTAVRNLRALVAEATKAQTTPVEGLPVTARDGTIPSPPPAITKPSPAMLAESRTEPDSTRLEKDFRAPTSGGRILVIDDDPSILRTLTDILKGEGYRVCPAENGKEGIKRLFQMKDCDLVLLDMMMPVLSGFDFLDIFDENPDWTMPVVILSAHMHDREYHTKDGGWEVFIGEKPREALKKPIYLEGFLSTVNHMVRIGKSRRNLK